MKIKACREMRGWAAIMVMYFHLAFLALLAFGPKDLGVDLRKYRRKD